ncbi:hypothetical protein [Nonomuraea sp. NPDC050310]|uniref:hypothetical protein n=1 Tax=Nonomuraea sp. NPDC050310 TaxID=3154935 RepID=UPI0033D47D9C
MSSEAVQAINWCDPDHASWRNLLNERGGIQVTTRHVIGESAKPINQRPKDREPSRCNWDLPAGIASSRNGPENDHEGLRRGFRLRRFGYIRPLPSADKILTNYMDPTARERNFMAAPIDHWKYFIQQNPVQP